MTIPVSNYYTPAPAKPSNGLATTAFVLGLVAVALAFIPFVNAVAFFLALLAVIFAVVGLAKARKVHVGTGFAITALILAAAAVIVASVVTASAVDMLEEAGSSEPVIEQPVDRPATTPEPTSTPEPGEPDTTFAQEQARLSAQGYLDLMGMSRQGLVDQLIFDEHFAGLSDADAEAAAGAVVDELGADFDAEAAESAAEYLDLMPFSRAELVDQLVFDGFTPAQAEHGVAQTGL